jgi:membrane fusion protein, multidrug efflux system
MSKFRLHKVAAVAVLVATAVWMGTGEFSSIGSATQAEGVATAQPEARAERTPRAVAVVDPPRVVHARTIRISGRTEADKRAVLAARVAGIVQELPVRQGDAIAAGDLVLRLETEGKESAVETARQLLAQRETEFAATERLVGSGNLPRLQLDNARSALASARSQLEAAEAELGRIEVRAPFSGVIDRVRTEIGSSVSQGSEIATLLSLDPIVAVGEVSERDIGYVRRNQRAVVRLVDDRVVEGEISYVSRDASPQTRTFRVEISISNPNGEIPAGMTTEITLRTQPVESVRLPRSVITLSADGDLGVRGVDETGKVVFHPIDLVDDTNQGLYLAGIPAAVRIIVAGQELVREGEMVNALPADEDTIRQLVGEFMGPQQR